MTPVERPSGTPLVAPRRGGLALSSWVVVAAVAAVLGAVSLARLHVFAVHQNERDALFLLERLASNLEQPLQGTSLRACLVDAGDGLDRLGDLEWLDSGHLLARHGYLFDLEVDATEEEPTWHLRAWPQRHGRTGLAAFSLGSDSGLRGHPNRPRLWSGLGEEPDLASPGWLRM